MKLLATSFSAVALLLVAQAAAAATAMPSFSGLPVSFEENVGQTDSNVRFVARVSGSLVFITSDELVTVLPGMTDEPRARDVTKLNPAADVLPRNRAIVRMKMIGASRSARHSSMDQLPGKSNYFIGNDPSKWRTNVSHYARVRLNDVYRGIDLVYKGAGTELEYDFVVKPGADPRRIRLRFEGAERVEVAPTGDLVLHTQAGEVRHRVPTIYQDDAGVQRRVPGAYRRIGRSEFSFEVGPYDPSRSLVIDPVIVYSTYLGGSSSDFGRALTVDGNGNVYVAGTTASLDFPIRGGFQPVSGYEWDAFVTKLNASGTALVYSTYLGGWSYDAAYAIAIDSAANVSLTGATTSPIFPTTTQPGHENGAYGGGYDAFVTRLRSDGAALIHSRYLGGTGEDWGSAVAVDAEGNTFVTGLTFSANFPVGCGHYPPLQSFPSSYTAEEAFVSKFSSVGVLLCSTYLGGSGQDYGLGIDFDADGYVYLTGGTSSADFPIKNAFQGTLGVSSAFVCKINPTFSALSYSTFLGSYSQGRAIAVDTTGQAYVTGIVWSSVYPFPLSSPIQAAHAGVSDAFITKFNAAGSNLLFSTLLGGSGEELVHSLALDNSNNPIICGATDSPNFPLKFELQGQLNGSGDAFVAKVDVGSPALLFSTYLGGLRDDSAHSVASDASGNLFVTGLSQGSGFPLESPFQVYNAFWSGFVTKISLAGPVLTISPAALPDGLQGSPYNQTLTASGGTPPYTFTTSVTPPAGLSLSTSGAISGTPHNDGQSAFVVKVTDSSGATGSRNYRLYVKNAIDPPVSVVASGASTVSIDIAWSSVPSAYSYRVYRWDSSDGFLSDIGSPSTTSTTDSGLAANSAYVYYITAVNGAGYESPLSAPDYATTVVPGATVLSGSRITAAHINSLRDSVNALHRLVYGTDMAFTDPTLSESTVVKAIHIQELRDTLDDARFNIDPVRFPALAFTDSALVPGVTLIRAIHLQELRDGVR